MRYMDENELRRRIQEAEQQAVASIISNLNTVISATVGKTYTETDLNNAVACENYELAAIIRDELNNK